MPKDKACKKTLAISTRRTNDQIEALFIASKKPMVNPPKVTSMFPLGERNIWVIKTGEVGTYHLYYKDQIMYVGQGILVTRVGKNLKEHQEFFRLKVKVAKNKKGAKWSVSPKIYNISKNIEDWTVECVIFDTGNPQLDKFHAKNHEDVMIEVHNPPLNYKKGDNT